MFIFVFKQYVRGRKLPVTHHIAAATHLEAFGKWCKLASIQDLVMPDLLQLEVTVRPREFTIG